ncbi:hypothetical protein DUNSADRAFT_2335 [Dunaliella salina]|uniref:Uncharacterized protein n=1 Tax=Dunaliella salina TaxID=3046 RepID=A0ABQ7GVU4_DUNSA|nr:hypothetical protein DUNSADRAFT_2335 [Dunaliella salina]|eukprot:KAF5838710.1 hypothetical protein DUNSADRAFT_2335 [Dunaliella salina]
MLAGRNLLSFTLLCRAQLLAKPYGHIELHRIGMQPQELAPVIDFLRLHLSLKPFHVETHPHEKEEDLEATSSEIV